MSIILGIPAITAITKTRVGTVQVHRVTMPYAGVTPTANTAGCSTVSCLVQLVQGTLRIHKTFTHYYMERWHIFSVGTILITLCFYELPSLHAVGSVCLTATMWCWLVVASLVLVSAAGLQYF